MFGLGGAEVALILLFGFLIFGPDKLPQIARTVGRVVRQFRTAQEQMNKVIQAEVYDPLKDLEPLANPFAGLNLEDALTGKKSEAKSDAGKTGAAAAASGKAALSGAATDKADKADKVDKKITSDEMKAALAAEQDKAKKQASAKAQTAAEKKTADAGGESFAERRARLEKAHAEAKTNKASENKTKKVEE